MTFISKQIHLQVKISLFLGGDGIVIAGFIDGDVMTAEMQETWRFELMGGFLTSPGVHMECTASA